MSIIKFFFIFFSISFIFGCVEKTTFSGKIITEEELSNVNLLNKNDLIKQFGTPSYKDDILNKYFYFTEKEKKTNFYNSKVEYSYLFVFEINDENKIVNKEVINLLTQKSHKYKKRETNNNIIKRGLIEKIFGGVGANQFPNSP